jgi:hypothetical protein
MEKKNKRTTLRRPTTERPPITILEAMVDPNLFGPWFARLSWTAWRPCLAGIFGLRMSEAMLEIFQRHTLRQTPPDTPAREAWLVVGRRGGKSRIAALVAVFLACLREYAAILAPGERATIMVIAADRRQARVVFRYVTGLLDGVPMLARLVESRTAEAVHLTNRVSIEVHTASFRAVRGYTIAAAICDEIAFWRSEDSANPDVEILNGLRPGMATVPGALLLCISSPYARRGALWESYRAHFGKDGDPVLVWKAETRAMHPQIDERVIANAFAADEITAAAEYGAEFRRDVDSFVSQEAVGACVVPGRLELAPVTGTSYFAFVDPSGGSVDSMALAIAHRENGRVLLDLVRERQPRFSPEDVVEEFAETLRRYKIHTVRGDRYGGEWPRERFAVHGITYEESEQFKNDLYRELLPLLNSRQVELLDHPRLLTQLLRLERKVARGGRDSIDHGPGGHDDVANAVAGALVGAPAYHTMVCSTMAGGERVAWRWGMDELEGRRSQYY